jgi:hypothetical protein
MGITTTAHEFVEILGDELQVIVANEAWSHEGLVFIGTYQ